MEEKGNGREGGREVWSKGVGGLRRAKLLQKSRPVTTHKPVKDLTHTHTASGSLSDRPSD